MNVVMEALVVVVMSAIITNFLYDLIKKIVDTFDPKSVAQYGDKYIQLAEDTVKTFVKKYNQTIVEELKKNNKFTKEKAIEVFLNCYKDIRIALGKQGLEILSTVFSDVDCWLKAKIEQCVRDEKNA